MLSSHLLNRKHLITFFSEFGVTVVIKNRDEILDLRIWESYNCRDTQEELDLTNIGRRSVTVLGPGHNLMTTFFHVLGSKDNSEPMTAMILTDDSRFLHSRQWQVPLDLL